MTKGEELDEMWEESEGAEEVEVEQMADLYMKWVSTWTELRSIPSCNSCYRESEQRVIIVT